MNRLTRLFSKLNILNRVVLVLDRVYIIAAVCAFVFISIVGRNILHGLVERDYNTVYCEPLEPFYQMLFQMKIPNENLYDGP